MRGSSAERARVLPLLSNVVGYPKRGTVYTDVSSAFADPGVLSGFVAAVAEAYGGQVDKILGVDSMGFLLASPVASAMALPLIVNRKGAKILPGSIAARVRNSYRSERIGVRRDGVAPGERILIVDDVVGTGDTLVTLARMVERLGGVVTGSAHLLELAFVAKRRELDGVRRYAHVSVDRAEFERIPRVRARSRVLEAAKSLLRVGR